MATTRPRGFAPYDPNVESAELIEEIQLVLDDHRDILPLTLRQIFYILLGKGYPKTQRFYKNLCEKASRARRGRLLDMEAIRDDESQILGLSGWHSEDSWLRSVKMSAEEFELDRQANQRWKVVIWHEARGMGPQLQAATEEYHVPIYTSGGFDSVTTKHNAAERFADLGDVHVLHIGDHDPSGVHMFTALEEDLRAFASTYGGFIRMTRLAVTLRQIDELELPTAPRNPADNRAFRGETTQAEAIPPRQLRQIVRGAVEHIMDMDRYQETLDEERRIRERLLDRLGSW